MSEINYYSQDSGVTVQEYAFDGASTARWRPGQAGSFERVAAGDGTGDGWFLYFVGRYLVLEIWRAGDWVCTRWIDCAPLLAVEDTGLHHLAGIGYALDQDIISIGCVTLSGTREIASVHEDFVIPGIGDVFTHPPKLHLGSMPVTVTGGVTQYRSLGAGVRGVNGRFLGREYLSRGELARLAGEFQEEVARA